MSSERTLASVLDNLPPQPLPDAAEECSLLDSARATSSPDLIGSVVALQHERTMLHKSFDDAFEECLSQGTQGMLKSYPPVVLRARVRFATIALQVQTSRRVFEERAADAPTDNTAKEIVQLVKKLEVLDKRRLDLLSASHLERHCYARVRPGGDDSTVPPEEVRRLKDSVKDFERRLGVIDEELQELASELRCCRADMEE